MSNRLQIAQRSKRIRKECVVCGHEILIKPSHARKEGTYCSKKCLVAGYKNRMIGKDNPNYKHGRCVEDIKAERRRLAKKWTTENKESARVHWRNKNAKRYRAPGRHTKNDVLELFAKQKGRCAICQVSIKRKYHVDHIVPLSRGGSNDVVNLQLLCPNCNHTKGAKMPIQHMQSLGYLL